MGETDLKEKKEKLPLEVKASLVYTVCSIIQKCLSFLTIPLFTRLLTTTQYGQYSIYVSWMAIFSIFTTLNLQYGTMGRAMMAFENRRDEYVANIQTICTSLTLLFIAVYLCVAKYVASFFELPTFIMIVMFLEIMFSSAQQGWMERQRFDYKYKPVVFVTILCVILSPLLALLFVYNSEERGYARILGYSAVAIIIGLILYVYNLFKGKKAFSKDMWKFALSMNLPLIAYYLSQVIFNQSDRIMISHMVGIDKAGIYSVAYNLAIVLNFVMIAINNSYVPWLYRKIKEGNTEKNRDVSCAIAIIIAVLLLGVIWCAPEIIYVMAGKEYAEAKVVVPPIAMSLLVLLYSQFFINIQFYYEKKYYLVIASIGAAVVNIVLNYLFIPRVGYYAAGYTTLVSYFVFAFCNYLAFRKTIKGKSGPKEYYNIYLLMLIMVLFLVLGFLALLLYENIILRYVIIAVVLVVFGINFRKISKFVKKTIKRN